MVEIRKPRELLTDDTEAAKKLYGALFGWTMERAPDLLDGVDY